MFSAQNLNLDFELYFVELIENHLDQYCSWEVKPPVDLLNCEFSFLHRSNRLVLHSDELGAMVDRQERLSLDMLCSF